MTDHEDNINLGKVVFDDNNQQRKTWACLRQTCTRYLIVFLSQVLVILLINFGCFWRLHLSKLFDEVIVWVGILCSAVSPKIQWQSSGILILFSKRLQNWKQRFRCTTSLHGMVWNSGCLDYSEFPNIRPRDMKGDCFAKVTQKCNFLGISLNKEVEKLDDHACPKFRELLILKDMKK